MIPKIAHFYWGEPRMPYLRYLTLKTFHRQNPGWKIILWTPTHRMSDHTWTSHEQRYVVTAPDCTHMLNSLPVEVRQIDAVAYDAKNSMAEVHKSDLLRWWLLSTVGGIWADMDILFFRPMPELHHDTGICLNTVYGHSIGLLFACENNQVFAMISAQAKKALTPSGYQSAGVLVLNKLYPTTSHIDSFFPQHRAFNIPMDWVYAYDATHIKEIYSNDQIPNRYTDSSIGLHWYAGHPLSGEFINKLTPENCRSFNTVIGQTLRRSLA